MPEHKSGLRRALEAAIAAIGKKTNADAVVVDAEGYEHPLHPDEKKKKNKYGYTREHKKAMEDAGVL